MLTLYYLIILAGVIGIHWAGRVDHRRRLAEMKECVEKAEKAERAQS